MKFQSILALLPNTDVNAETAAAPAYFTDLNLDQIVAAITAGKDDYNLKPFFYEPLETPQAIVYRQEVMRDLENPALFNSVSRFASKMKSVRDHLIQAGKMYYTYQKRDWFLDATDIYCDAVNNLLLDAKAALPSSDGFVNLISYLSDYVNSPFFGGLLAEIANLKARLASIRYYLRIGNNSVTVSRYDSEVDYSAEIQADFEKFKQGAAADHRFKFSSDPQMDHIEAGVLARVARLYPEIFSELDAFAARNANVLDRTICRFDREVQFYVSYIDYLRRFRNAGLQFCYPYVTRDSKEIQSSKCFDVALAKSLLDKNSPIVTNDFYLRGEERMIIVSGPNQGGKTTFARMFGQVHHLAAIGCPVPGADARLFLFDKLFAHFEREEDIHNLRGKLHDDLFRMHETLTIATSNSIIILNEVFNSTSLRDSIFLSTKILSTIIELDAICVCVTFIDELAKLSNTTVSMASNVEPDNAAERTYKIIRRPLDGLAYAISIAEKYQVTYSQLKERLKS